MQLQRAASLHLGPDTDRLHELLGDQLEGQEHLGGRGGARLGIEQAERPHGMERGAGAMGPLERGGGGWSGSR